jgi:hypothetical protein
MSDAPTGPTDPIEMMRRMWAQTGMPLPGLSVPNMMVPTFNVAELDKRINDLRSVENWLTLNLNVLRMTIQGMEMQKATLNALKAMQPPGIAPAPGEEGAPSAADAWWNMFQQVTGQKPPGQQEK